MGLIGLIGLISPIFVLASTTNGTIDGTYKYSWGENLGWVNFGVTGGNVHVTDSQLTGYVWSGNYGWINLNPTQSGVKNNGEGVLSGSAWGENLGWINFSNVSINSSGQFTGSASGTVSGRINFDCSNCKVKTDWRPQSARSTSQTSGGGGGMPAEQNNPPTSPAGGFAVLINNDKKYATDPIVLLTLRGGPNTEKMAISNFSDFRDAGQENYQKTKEWDLCKGLSFCLEGEYTVYAKFYAPWGKSSETVSDKIIYKKEIPIIERVPEILRPLISKFLKPQPTKIPIEKLVPKETPLTFQNKWQLLPAKQIREFVLAPLPKAIRNLAQKFPTLEKTFKEVGIGKITDVLKLQTVKLTLPGLTERAGPEGVPLRGTLRGKPALLKDLPIAKLTPQIKRQLPAEVVFARTGGELIDFNIALSVNEKGEPQQKISTISGKPLQLAVKPDKPVKSIKGYVVFKSKAKQATSLKIPLNSLLASAIFANPVFAKTFTPTPNDFISVEGAKLARFDLALKDNVKSENFGVGASEQPVRVDPVRSKTTESSVVPLLAERTSNGVEEKLVLLEFEYTDPDGDGIYTAEIQAPVVEGEYEIITVMDFEDPGLGKREIRLTTAVDPEGYIYEKEGGKETRIPGAIISLFWLNPETKQYETWPAKEYQQENPQTTDVRGTYSFLVPEGYYNLKVEAPGYLVYDGKSFQVREGSGVHVNIELKTKYWWLKIADWKTILLAIFIILLLYNFYRDKIREKSKKI